MLTEILQTLLDRPPGGGFSAFGDLLHKQVRFDRLTLCAAEPSGRRDAYTGLRVLHALAGEDGTSEAVGRLLPLDRSLAGQVFVAQRSLRIDDLRSPPGWTQPPEALEDNARALYAGMSAALCLPLSAAGGPVGVCQLWSRQRGHFTAADEQVMLAIQPALSAVLRNDLLFVEAERRSLELGALEQLARKARTSLDIDEVVPACLDAALSLLGLPTGGLLLLREGALELQLARNLRLRGPLYIPLSPPEDGAAPDSPLAQAARTLRPVLCGDVAQDPQLSALLHLEMQARRVFLLAIPLLAGETARGVVFACGYDAFPGTVAELERLATIGHWIGTAISAAEQHRREILEARKQEELRRRQLLLESLSGLAGGLAHDFNNTLGAVLLTALLLREAADQGEPTPPSQLVHDLDVIIEAARRGASLAGQLLAFSRGVPLHLQPLHLNEAVREAAAPFADGKLVVHTELAPGLPKARGDREQIVRALQHLLRNAAEAMPDGGRLTVQTLLHERTVAEEGARPDGAALPPGRYVRILVQDDGPGIDPAVRARLFEPFVTTKQGSAGLGLAVVFGVMRAHGGGISVDSAPGRGTTFRLELPLGAVEVPLQVRTEGGQGARVLIVDDEPVLTRIAARVLRKEGYLVDTAQSGGEALSRYAAPGDYDMVLLDLSMPGMSGRQVLEQLLQRDPGARVLLMSGYSKDGEPAQVLAEGARAFLAKPFTPQDLLEATRTTMQSLPLSDR